MKNYFSNWNFMRALRLALGLFIIVQGIKDQQWILAVMGGAFSLMAIFGLGCSSSAGCATPMYSRRKKTEDVTYEEIK